MEEAKFTPQTNPQPKRAEEENESLKRSIMDIDVGESESGSEEGSEVESVSQADSWQLAMAQAE